FLHYKTDTAPGSSGAPLFNDRWEVVGLHHSGVPRKNAAGQILAVDGQVWHPEMGEQRIDWIANEGIRISRIIADVREKPLQPAERRLLDGLLIVAPAPPHETRVVPVSVLDQVGGDPVSGAPSSASVAVAADGTATWTIPISVSVKIGGA